MPVGFLRPFAITGQFSYSIADKGLKATPVIDPDTGLTSLQFNNGNSNQWFGGISLQLQHPLSAIPSEEFGTAGIHRAATPLIEITWSSPATSPSTQGTTWIAAPGVIYSAPWYQVGIEALIPLNKAAGTNVGVIAQFHVFFDDLFPNTLGKPVVDWFR